MKKIISILCLLCIWISRAPAQSDNHKGLQTSKYKFWIFVPKFYFAEPGISGKVIDSMNVTINAYFNYDSSKAQYIGFFINGLSTLDMNFISDQEWLADSSFNHFTDYFIPGQMYIKGQLYQARVTIMIDKDAKNKNNNALVIDLSNDKEHFKMASFKASDFSYKYTTN